MIRGVVNARLEAMIPVQLRGPGRLTLDLDAVIDTGYTGRLAVPDDVITALDLMLSHRSEVVLADGSLHDIVVYEGDILWHEVWRPVFIFWIRRKPLLGMQLMEVSYLQIVVDGSSEVIITYFFQAVDPSTRRSRL